MDENTPQSDPLGDYSAMFLDYLAGQDWITPADAPLVFHLKKLCAHLDAKGLDNAAMSSAYLKAFNVLESRRPKPKGAGADEPHPDQTSIFDELGDP